MISQNLKFLRRRENLSQAELAEKLSIPRTTLSAYERAFVEPNIDLMRKLCKFFSISLDDLVAFNFEHNNPDHEGENGLRILAISVDSENNSNIELVETKASAGYLDSFFDPEYIKELPKIYFPNIPQGTYRGFQIHGDSMLPLNSGTIIISSFIEKITDIKDDKTYVIVSKTEGLVYKRVKNLSKEKALLLVSDNQSYFPYKIQYSDIAEVWQHYAHLSFTDDKLSSGGIIEDKINDILSKVTSIDNKLDN
jgi:transcriptional regulator with XRE-family HTH domain